MWVCKNGNPARIEQVAACSADVAIWVCKNGNPARIEQVVGLKSVLQM
jgi:hypothetical protein